MLLTVKGWAMDKTYQSTDTLNRKCDTLLQLFILESLLRNYLLKILKFVFG